jgi:hypothetical protein
MESAVSELDEAPRIEATAFLVQARDFYRAATHSEIGAAKPLLLYYGFLNLAKCYAVYASDATIGSGTRHGLSERLPTTLGAVHGDVRILRNQDAVSAFAKLSGALQDPLPAANPGLNYAELRSQDFLSQILIGHRIWCLGEGINERFISLQDVRYRHDPDTHDIWITVRMFKDDLSRFGYSLRTAAAALNSRLGGAFHSVACQDEFDGRLLVEFELTNKLNYPNRPSEALQALSDIISRSLWRSITTIPPFRKYYIYIKSPTQTILSQLQSLYLSTFYFGSITRYKPQNFAQILNSDIGPFVQEFFTNQPSQFLYLMASRFVEQEVTKAAIV